MTSDGELLRRYTESKSEDAFAELVQRHLDLVYSAALRQVNGDSQLAQDVAQLVFSDLARKADRLRGREALAGWLYTGAHYAAAKAVRAEQRRHTREQEGHAMQELLTDGASNPDWEALRPILDTAMHEISDSDREVIVLRYFENRPHSEVGRQLGLSDDSARKRTERALEKLRMVLTRRGITTSTTALSLLLPAHSIQAAPAGLAAAISTTAALGGASTAATATAGKLIVMTTLQKTVVALIVIAAASTPVILKHREVTRLRKEVEALRREKESLLSRQPAEPAQAAQATANPVAGDTQPTAPASLEPAEVVAKIAALLAERKPMDRVRMETWFKLQAQIPPNRMDDAMLAALQLPDGEVGTAIAKTLFHRWIETDPRAALAFATVKFRGQERATAIRDALQQWATQDPYGAFAAWREQAADSTGRLNWGGSRQANVKGLFEGIAQKDLPKAVSLLEGLDRDLFGSALQGMGAAAAKTPQGRELFLKQLEQVSHLSASGYAVDTFFGRWSDYDLPSAIEWIEGQPEGRLHDSALTRIGASYARRDPKVAAEWWLAQATTPSQRGSAIFCITQEWALKDIQAAGEWLTGLINQHPGDTAEFDGGRLEFANLAAYEEPATAMQWAATITTPSLRNPALARIWQKWRQTDRAAAEQFLAQSGWPAELVAKARGEANK